uniref:LAGLIDADG endonuclease n=1 Tax=Cubamyces lactineus TaxID=1391043 RepID=UPI0030035C3F
KSVFTEKILLYAGNSCISSPLALSALGKIYLNSQSGQSAGNFTQSTKASASTKNTYTNYKNLTKISEHVPTHNSNLSATELGYYLAGIIEGDGWFGEKELHINFNYKDISLAYYIKKRIGYGNVYRFKNKKAVRYICKHEKGLSIILSLINGKLVSKPKYDQLIKHNYSEKFNCPILPPSNVLNLDNHWLAGYTQANGCFHIIIAKSNTHKTGFSVRLEYSLKQNDSIPLKLLYKKIKMGNLSQYPTGIWCYKSTGYKTAALLINYFDQFHLFADKYVNYLKFRKVYIMITEGKHLEDKGIIKIKSISGKGSSETSTQEV